jgi:uncharacterized membrane protein (Fun14 family)
VGTQEEVRPAWYALGSGGWRDYVTLLHPPYTLWHLSYVAIGAAIAPHFHTNRMAWGIAAFFLAMGIAAHALDELHGRPLRTRIPAAALVALAVISLAGAVAIGIGAAIAWGWGLIAFVAIGAVLVPAYNLEIAFHNDVGFAVAWGAFPALTGYFVEAQTLRLEAVAVAAFAFAASLAQRALSTPVRQARRAQGTTAGTEPLERALRALTWGMVALAVGLVAARLR